MKIRWWHYVLVPALATSAQVYAEATADTRFPTVDVVGHVMNCMQDNGGQTTENLYACACRLDVVANEMTFEDYELASTYERYRRMPGEKGGLFRESVRSDELVQRLQQARAEAVKRCPLVKRSAKPANPEQAAP